VPITTPDQQCVSVPGLRRLLDGELLCLLDSPLLSADGHAGAALARMVVLDLLRRLELPETEET
jgi:hypothetical protein